MDEMDIFVVRFIRDEDLCCSSLVSPHSLLNVGFSGTISPSLDDTCYYPIGILPRLSVSKNSNSMRLR